MELISVIIPVYNLDKYLKNCLDSVINQTYQNLEIILVNDGSNDCSGAICDEYAKKDSRIRVIHKENGGVSSARNAGLDIAKGEYIGFVDGDDIIDDNLFEVLYETAKNFNSDITACGIVQHRMDGTVQTLSDDSLKNYEKSVIIKGFFDDNLIKETMYGPVNKIIKRKVVDSIRFKENLTIAEDLLFLFNCIEKSDTVVLNNKPLYHYLKRENSITTSKFSEKKLDYIKAADIMLFKCENEYPFAFYSALKWNFYQKLTILRQLNRHYSIKKRNIILYKEMYNFIKQNKKSVLSSLSFKRKIDLVLVLYFPLVYKYLKI